MCIFCAGTVNQSITSIVVFVKLEWHSKRLYLEVKQNLETAEMLVLIP